MRRRRRRIIIYIQIKFYISYIHFVCCQFVRFMQNFSVHFSTKTGNLSAIFGSAFESRWWCEARRDATRPLKPNIIVIQSDCEATFLSIFVLFHENLFPSTRKKSAWHRKSSFAFRTLSASRSRSSRRKEITNTHPLDTQK